MTNIDECRTSAAPRRAPHAPHPVRAVVPPTPGQVGPAHRIRWRRSTARRITGRRVIALARFGVGTGLDPDLVQVDESVRRSVNARAERVAGRVATRLDKMHGRTSRLRDRADDLRRGADRRDELVADPVAGTATMAQVGDYLRADRERVRADESAGDRSHRRPARWIRALARVLPWLDAALFAYFVSGVSNADLTDPLSTPVASAVTLALTLLVVLVLAGFAPWVGRRLRADKDARGEIDWDGLGTVSTSLLVIWAVLMIAISATMAVRIHQEATLSGASAVTALVVTSLLVVCAMAMCVFVLGVAFADGTVVTDDRDRRSRLVLRHASRRRRALRRADGLDRRRVRIERRAAALRRDAVRRVVRIVQHGERMLHVAHLRTGVSRPAGEPPVPEIEPEHAGPTR